jgi:hypothetical protein
LLFNLREFFLFGDYLKNQLINSSFDYSHCRSVLVVVGITSFSFSKASIDQKRYENMRIRDRMKKANTGEYQLPERFEQLDKKAPQ